MNMVHRRRRMAAGRMAGLVVLFAVALGSLGCNGAHPGGRLAAFERAGPVRCVVDTKDLAKANLSRGPYRVVIDDLLELHMPIVMREILPERADLIGKAGPVLSRVGKSGAIRLPIVGEIPAAGKTLADIETAVVESYYPKYANQIPSVAVCVKEHSTSKVSVVGAVEEPGIYELRSDEMSLVAVLMKAGGVLSEGASAIRIHRANASEDSPALLLPIRGLNIPFTDVALEAGDTVEVEGLGGRNFTVVGLVREPGVFQYPPDVRYNLAQALAMAGGTNVLRYPQYAKICRQDASGRMLVLPLKIGGDGLVEAADVFLKPGDVVAVEQSLATETRWVLMQLLRVSFGVHGSFSI